MDTRRVVIATAAAASMIGAPTALASPAANPAEPRPYLSVSAETPRLGRRAIAEANQEARTASRSDRFEGGVQVFGWAPGRIYEVWTAPLRVTSLTLAPGEALLSKAAGDTVRWQLGEVRSGGAADGRVHVLIKPLQRGLETNLMLMTDQRVYLIALRSGPVETFNPAVAWDVPHVEPALEPPAEAPAVHGPVTPSGPLNARYRIEPVGRRPAWTPTAVFDDGRRTFIAFAPDLALSEAPALFGLGSSGDAQFLNYRQGDGVFIVDRLLDQAELRLGDRRPQVVRIRRLGARP
jgi:type IV secretion system protein TrbG